MELNAGTPVVVARILRPHGLHGELVLESLTDVPDRLEKTVGFLLLSGGIPMREVRVVSRRFFNGKHVFKFEGIENLSQAEMMRGMELAVPETELGPLHNDQFFIHQLIGMKVQLKDGTELGSVTNVLRTGGVDVLEIGTQGNLLIPFAAEICVDVNVKENRLIIDPPEGLLQINAR